MRAPQIFTCVVYTCVLFNSTNVVNWNKLNISHVFAFIHQLLSTPGAISCLNWERNNPHAGKSKILEII